MEDTLIEIGDTVLIQPYTTQTMSGNSYPGSASNKTGVVIRLSKSYDWMSYCDNGTVRVLAKDDDTAVEELRPLAKLSLVSKGNGTVVLGQTHPFSKQELREQRWDSFVSKVQAVDLQHVGFKNGATFMAWMYLDQEAKVHAALPRLRRKDGTIHPNKLNKLFRQCKFQIDEWAFKCPLDLPEEFKHRPNPVKDRQALDWTEVADQFALKND